MACGWTRLVAKCPRHGNTVELDVLQRHFPIDAIRYFCLREMVFGQDGRFGYESLIDRTNSDLASGLKSLQSHSYYDRPLLRRSGCIRTDPGRKSCSWQSAAVSTLTKLQSRALSSMLETIFFCISKIMLSAELWKLHGPLSRAWTR